MLMSRSQTLGSYAALPSFDLRRRSSPFLFDLQEASLFLGVEGDVLATSKRAFPSSQAPTVPESLHRKPSITHYNGRNQPDVCRDHSWGRSVKTEGSER